MTTRFLIALAACACALHASHPPAHSQGADNFIPDQPPKTGADAGTGDSHTVKYALLLPSEKSSEAVKDGERNPFGGSDDGLRDSGGKSTSEETKIQEQLSKLHATGLSPGPAGLRVLLGDMWLSKNDVLPAVIKDQTLALRVNEITRESIELVWMEKKFTGLPPRLLVIPVDLRPTVRRVPHGQLPEKPDTKTESPASKRATMVEIPASVAANGDVAEARKAARQALASVGPQATAQPGPKDPAISAAAPPRPPSTASTPSPPAPGIAATQTIFPVESAAPVAAPPGGAQATASSADQAQASAGIPKIESVTASVRAADLPVATATGNPTAPTTPEPPAWKRAMGLIDNLVKLSEAGK